MSVDLSIPVLVVHDYPTMGAIITTVLRQIGFENIDGANDGREALKKLSDGGYGLVISDETMASMSGEDLLRALRARPQTAETPFVLLRARIEAEFSVKRANVVTKPFNARKLHSGIEAAIRAA